MMIHSTKTTITPRTIQPVVDMRGSWGGAADRRWAEPGGGTPFGRGHQEVGSRFHRKKPRNPGPDRDTAAKGKKKTPGPGRPGVDCRTAVGGRGAPPGFYDQTTRAPAGRSALCHNFLEKSF